MNSASAVEQGIVPAERRSAPQVEAGREVDQLRVQLGALPRKATGRATATLGCDPPPAWIRDHGACTGVKGGSRARGG